jgi:mitochondrial import inner membrane translocase subunit TIM44
MQRTILKRLTKNLNVSRINLNQRYYSNNDSFFNIFKSEMKKNLEKEKEFQESLKEVQESKTGQTLKKASENLDELSKKTSETVSSTLKPIKETYTGAKTKIVESEVYKKTSETVEKISETVAENPAVKFVVDDLAQGDEEKQKHVFNFRSKFKRDKDLEQGIYYNPYTNKIEKLEDQQVNTENTGMVISKKKQKTESGLQKRLNELATSMEEKANPFSAVAKVALKSSVKFVDFMENTIFKSTELAEVLTAIKENDPTFELTPFLYQVEHKVIPEVLDAYFKDDVDVLKSYVSKKVFLFFF